MTDEEIRLRVDDPVVDSDGVKLSVEASGAKVGEGRRCFWAAAAADSSLDFTWKAIQLLLSHFSDAT